MVLKRMISVLLTAALVLSCAAAGTVTAFAGSVGNPDGVYMKQISSGKCTLASATMMLRQKSLNEGNETWQNITQESVRNEGWVEGVGIKISFTYYGMTVKRVDFDSGEDRREALLELLDEHPEGVAIYDRGIPHAVLLTRYDEDEDTFYCADPGLSDQEMTLAESWLRKTFSGAGQEDILNAVDCAWVITSYEKQDIPVYSVSSGSDDSTEADENEEFFYEEDSSSDENKTADDTGSSQNTSGSDVLVDDSDDDSKSTGAVKNDDPSAGMSIFSKIREYAGDLFSDVDLTQWYAPYVQSVYEAGLMSGMSGVKAGTFDVDGSMTLAQSITIASRIYSKYAVDGEPFNVKSGDSWIDPYLRYAEKNGIITSETASSDTSVLDAPVTRAQFAEIISAALSDSACGVINAITSNQFSDIYETDDMGHAVYRLCRAGIITGGTDGRFCPDETITRAQVAAIIARVIDDDLRVKI